jgi:hypothetical protein
MNRLLAFLLVLIVVSADAQTIRRRIPAVVASATATVYRDTIDADNRDAYGDSSAVGVLTEALYMQTSPVQSSSVSRYPYTIYEGHEEVGYEFQVNLAKNTVVDSAFLFIQLYSVEATYGVEDTSLIGSYAENAAVFNAAHSHNMTAHQTNSGKWVKWRVPSTTGSYIKSPDIKTLVQDPINSASWASGQYVGVFLKASASWSAAADVAAYTCYDYTAGRLAYIEVWTH